MTRKEIENNHSFEDMSGKICIVTGANSGLGKQTAKSLAKLNAKVVMVCRSKERGQNAKEEILKELKQADLDLMLCDLSNLSEVRDFAQKFNQKYTNLDVLINNAGVYYSKYEETEDGIAKMIAINHFSPFLLTKLLLPLLKESNYSRIINVNSGLHKMAKLELNDVSKLKNWKETGMKGYATSKLVNLLSIYKMARELENSNTIINAVNPGMTNTNLPQHSFGTKIFWKLISPFIKTAEEGAKPIINLATNPELAEVNGKYFEGFKIDDSSDVSYNIELQEKVYKKSLEITQLSKN